MARRILRKATIPRFLANLTNSIRQLPNVLVYDNSDLGRPFRQVAVFEPGRKVYRARVLPKWFKDLLDSQPHFLKRIFGFRGNEGREGRGEEAFRAQDRSWSCVAR